MVNLCVVTVNMGSLVAYVNVLADVWSAVTGTIIPPGAEPSRGAMMTGAPCRCRWYSSKSQRVPAPVIMLLGALPVALLVRGPQLLSRASQASVGYAFVFGIAIAALAVSSPTDWGMAAV